MEFDKKQVCAYCRSLINNEDGKDSFGNKCAKWLNNCTLSDCSDCRKHVSSSGLNFISRSIDNFSDNKIVSTQENIHFEDKIILMNSDNQILSSVSNNLNNYKDINIHNSQNIHIGNITNVYGSVVINQNNLATDPRNTINSTTNSNARNFPIVPRRIWLAQPPVDPEDVKYFSQVPKYVIISIIKKYLRNDLVLNILDHSATDEAFTQTENNLLVRLIQQFHIESRKWNDIAYNFLVGAEGTIYEGRGWKVIGAHTLGYNSIGIGICFIGCYMKKLPPAEILKKVQEFIRYGVDIGFIAKDYSLLAHCQCRSSENPGRTLFEEIKTWDRWDGSIYINNRSSKISS